MQSARTSTQRIRPLRWQLFRIRGMLLALLLTLQVTSTLSCADYQDLGPGLTAEQRSAWEASATTEPKPMLADLIWFAYAQGYGAPIDYTKAKEWHSKALVAEQPLAQLFQVLSLRNRHWINEYAEPDPQTVNKSMQEMLINAQRQFNQMPDGPAVRCWQGLAELELGQTENGLKQLHFASEADYAEADAWLGYYYCYRKRDYKKAIHHYEKAHHAGIAWASTDLGNCYLRAWGVPRDREAAIGYYKIAAEQNERKALLYYAQQNIRDPLSLPYAQRAAEIGDPDAMHTLALRYERGQGCDIQSDQAIALHESLYTRFAESKRWPHYGLRASYELGRINEALGQSSKKESQIKHYQQSKLWYQRLLSMSSNKRDQRILNAHVALGKHAEYGLAQEIDLQAAIKHYNIAASEKNGEAQMHLAQCYFQGSGVEKNLSTAKDWYEKALNSLHRRDPHLAECQSQYGICLEALDIELAIEKYKTFSQQGNADASYRLVEIYRQRKIHTDDIQDLVAQAAEQGHAQAQQELETYTLESDAQLLNDF